MSRLFIKHLKIVCFTDGGKFGCEIPFQPGLNIIRAENTSGKSTCLNAILYALGLEAILGKNGAQSLKPAVRTELKYKGRIYKVLESFVELEIGNQYNQVLTIKRQIKGERDDRLIIVNQGGRLSDTSIDSIDDYYYIRDSGAAQRERGFHLFLANFLGLNLPKVETFEGGEVLLYLECIFPSFFIEQKRGWSNIQATIPTKFRIKNVAQTATEYTLGLDVAENKKKKKDIESKKTQIKSHWQVICNTLKVYSEEIGGVLNGFPTAPVTSEDEINNARIVLFEDNKRFTLDEWIFKTRDIVLNLKQSLEVVRQDISENNGGLREELNKLESSLLYYEAATQEARNNYYSEEANRDLLIERIKSLDEDLVKNQDAVKLKKFGASIEASVSNGECPTCHQLIEDSLLEQPNAQVPMTIEKNIEFIKQQKGAATSVLARTEEIMGIKKAIYVSKQESSAITRQKIQDLKTNLTQDKRIPNIGLIRELVNKEEKLNKVINIREKFTNSLKEAKNICSEWNSVRILESNLPKDFLSHLDKSKLSKFTDLFREDIISFKFRSVPPSSIEISKDTYRPVIEGFEMSSDASASDNIRLIWAFTLALQELSNLYQTNHLKISFFDEPVQQKVNPESSRVFYHKMAAFSDDNQFITTTSEPKESFSLLIKNISCRVFEFGDELLKPMKTSD